eukprot:708166-Hanusia_phi.AAC.1
MVCEGFACTCADAGPQGKPVHCEWRRISSLRERGDEDDSPATGAHKKPAAEPPSMSSESIGDVPKQHSRGRGLYLELERLYKAKWRRKNKERRGGSEGRRGRRLLVLVLGVELHFSRLLVEVDVLEVSSEELVLLLLHVRPELGEGLRHLLTRLAQDVAELTSSCLIEAAEAVSRGRGQGIRRRTGERTSIQGLWQGRGESQLRPGTGGGEEEAPGEEGVGDSLLASSSCPSDAVNVVLCGERKRVVDHKLHVRNVKSARGNVGGDKEGNLSGLERLNGGGSSLLPPVAMDRADLEARLGLDERVNAVALLLVERKDDDAILAVVVLAQHLQQPPVLGRGLEYLRDVSNS